MMKSLFRLLAVTKKEIRQLRRDRLTFGMIVGIPVLQMLLFGFAINTDVRNLATAISNEANTHLSRQFVAELRETQVVNIVAAVNTPEELEELLRRGEISIGVVIPADFDRRVLDASRAAVHLLVDGSDPTISSVANQLRSMPIHFDSSIASSQPVQNIEIRSYYNPERRTPVNVIPGLMGIILTLTMMLFTAVAIVRERERGNLELLINTPVTSAELMIGKVLPYIAIGMIQLALILAVGDLLFQVPMRGSVIDLYLASAVFIAANLALGLFISTAAKTQFQAMQVTFFILMPSILLSGFVFPFDGMPTFARYLGEILPTTHYIRLTRGIMLRDANLNEMLPELLALGVFAIVALIAASVRFTKRLD
jgi:ABC-2 type transport system permease protein